jgi:predicted secreted hydrolase
MTRRDLLAAPFFYQPARTGYRYEFPRDHFNHPDFRTEWWYYTGNLESESGRPFGYELTFFRQAITRKPAVSASIWNVEDVYLAHLALSDIENNRFYHFERLNRPGPGIAGVSLEGKRVWNGNWQVVWRGEQQVLSAIAPEFRIDFTLDSKKPPIIHGEGGISQKEAGFGNASHYISFTRLLTGGRLELEGRVHQVRGASWMDHEFFSHQLGGELEGWDWFSLQFDDLSELMIYQLRRKDGQPNPFSSGTFIESSGRANHLTAREFTLEPLRRWRSKATGGNYPLAWRIRVPKLNLELETRPAMDSQELVSSNKYSPSYWEGAIRIAGSRTGKGYLEMTGYDKGVNIGGGG